jgi:hypothetical protein
LKSFKKIVPPSCSKPAVRGSGHRNEFAEIGLADNPNGDAFGH